MCIHRTIRQLRKRAGFTQSDLAKTLGVDQSTISQWENARTVPELDKIPQLAKLFGVSEQTFFDGLPDSKQAEATKDLLESGEERTPFTEELKHAYVNATSMEHLQVYASRAATVPLITLGRVHAGNFVDEELVGKSVEVPATFLRDHPSAQAIVVEGDCMSRVAPNGSIAVFDPDLPPTNGRIAIVETADHQAIMRRWHKGASKLLLEADSYCRYDDIVLEGDDPIRVIGTVVRVIIPDDLL